MVVAEVVVTVNGIVVVTTIPVVVKFAIGVVVRRGYITHYQSILILSSLLRTRVVTVGVVGGVVAVVVVLDNAGFQISNCQNAGLVIGADSASIKNNHYSHYEYK